MVFSPSLQTAGYEDLLCRQPRYVWFTMANSKYGTMGCACVLSLYFKGAIEKRTTMIWVTKLKSNVEINKEKTYVLPDGNIVAVGAERFHCANVLLQPNFFVKGASGIHDTSFSRSP